MACISNQQYDAFRRGQLGSETAHLVSAHLESCRTCQSRYDDSLTDDRLLSLARSVVQDADDLLQYERFTHPSSGIFETPAIQQDDVPHIPGYELIRELTRGGQGVVFEAEQLITKRRVAIKLLREGLFASARLQDRFRMELELAASLQHPNIVRIFDGGVAAGHPYYVMSLVRGTPLRTYLSEHTLTRPEMLRLFIKICRAVNYAHNHGVIHRDLKPSNVLVDEQGEPQLLDFGLAMRSVGGREPDRLTMTSSFAGTVAYASPEHVSGGEQPVGMTSDVYSLGIMLYQLLSDAFPYPVAGSLADVMQHIMHTDPTRIRQHNHNIATDLELIVHKCLAKEPQHRYHSVSALTTDIEHYLMKLPISARPASLPYQLHRWMSRHRTFTLIMALIVAISVTSGLSIRRSLQAQQYAQQKAAGISTLMVDLFGPVRRNPTQSQSIDTLLIKVEENSADRFASSPAAEAAIRHALGISRRHVGDSDKAIQHLTRAVSLRRDTLPDDHIDLADSLYSLGRLYGAVGRIRDSEPHLQEALAIRRSQHGVAHLSTLWNMEALSTTLRKQGRLGEARALLHEALSATANLTHQDQLLNMFLTQNFAMVLRAQGHTADAEVQYRKVLRMKRRCFGDNHISTIRTMNHIAQCHMLRSSFEQAEQIFQASLAIHSELDGRGIDGIVGTLNGLGTCSYYQQRMQEAEAYFDRVLSEAPQQNPWQKRQYARALSMKARITLQQGDASQAEQLARRAIALHRTMNHTKEAALAYCENVLGASLAQQRRFEEAEQWLTSGYDKILHSIQDRSHPRKQQAIRNVINLYDAWGKPEKAESYRKDLIEDSDATSRRVAIVR